MDLSDMHRFDKYFKIQPPSSQNWIFYSALSSRSSRSTFIDKMKAANPTAVSIYDVYRPQTIYDNLTRWVNRENEWKTWAFVSYRYSLMVQGTVHLLLPKDVNLVHPREDSPPEMGRGKDFSTWELFEMFALTSSGKVERIVRYDEEGFGVVGVVWERGQEPLGKEPDFEAQGGAYGVMARGNRLGEVNG
jgi:hypothetical protein